MNRTALVIMARSPDAGLIKTRLSAVLDPMQRIALYEELLQGTIHRLRAIEGTDTMIAVAPEGSSKFIKSYFDRFALPLITQQGEDLGTRMHSCVKEAHDRGYEQVVLVGTDIPELSPLEIMTATDMLKKADIILGPSEDGGFYLAAMRKAHAGLFDGIRWSAPDTLKQTVSRAEALGLSTAFAPVLWDIDTPGDYERYLNLIQ